MALVQDPVQGLGIAPSSDPVLTPFYEALAKMVVVPAANPFEASTSEREVRSGGGGDAPANRGKPPTFSPPTPALQAGVALLRMHNSSLPFEGHMIKATVVGTSRRTVTLDTGLRVCRVARSEITPDCLVGTVRPPAAAAAPHAQAGIPVEERRRPGECVGGWQGWRAGSGAAGGLALTTSGESTAAAH